MCRRCRPAAHSCRDVVPCQAILEPSVAELVHGPDLTQHTTPVGVVQELHDPPGQAAAEGEPDPDDDKAAARRPQRHHEPAHDREQEPASRPQAGQSTPEPDPDDEQAPRVIRSAIEIARSRSPRRTERGFAARAVSVGGESRPAKPRLSPSTIPPVMPSLFRTTMSRRRPAVSGEKSRRADQPVHPRNSRCEQHARQPRASANGRPPICCKSAIGM